MSVPDDIRSENRLRAAAFLCEALGLDLDPAELAAEIDLVKYDTLAHVHALELDTTAGIAAFLVYQYRLAASGNDGQTGATVFRDDLETLEIAAEHGTPGPRILAHATTDDEGYILVTTPDIHRALTGQGVEQSLEATESDLPPGADTSLARQQSADELLRLLKLANDQAKRWFAARRAEERLAPDALPFSQAESALALFLIDRSSIQDLLKLLSVFVDTTRQQSPRSADFQDE